MDSDSEMAGGHAVAPGTSSAPLLVIESLSVAFRTKARGLFGGREYLRAVNDVSFSIARGETLGLVGESGSGKSTLARAIMGLNTPTGGRIVFDGIDQLGLSRRARRAFRRHAQMIFQDPFGSLNPRMTIGALVGEPLRVHRIASRDDVDASVRDLLAAVGLPPEAATRYPHEFSGGQRQRVAIARAIATEPSFVIADEAVSALDVSIRASIINLLVEAQRRLGLSYLFIAHDLAIVRHVSDRIAVMYLGRIVELSDTDSMFATPRHPYTVALLSAVPVPDPDANGSDDRIILDGSVPSPLHPPSGCHFHPRCWLRTELGNPEQCTTELPLLRSVAGGEVACHFAERMPSVDPGGSQRVSVRSSATEVST